MVFIDLEKAYDNIVRMVMWWALEKHKSRESTFPSSRICTHVLRSVPAGDGETDTFPINIGLHQDQGSALSTYIFDLVMDEITKDIQGDIPWCMFFVDDVVLVDESRVGVNRKLELWR
jgi:hypothetical protein